MKKIIYDFGANVGVNIPYYLQKADLVVAVEANPALCDIISSEYNSEISSGKLVVENCVLTDVKTEHEVDFYIHKERDYLSQFPKPSESLIEKFIKKTLPSQTAHSIIQKHGTPFYIKIDIERFDYQLLKSLYQDGYFPPYISAEAHDISVFCMLVVMGYKSFKLVEGSRVSNEYGKSTISTNSGNVPYSFSDHSAGPFGEDIKENWMCSNSFSQYLSFEGLGWKDIHATRLVDADLTLKPRLNTYCKRAIMKRLKRYLPF